MKYQIKDMYAEVHGGADWSADVYCLTTATVAPHIIGRIYFLFLAGDWLAITEAVIFSSPALLRLKICWQEFVNQSHHLKLKRSSPHLLPRVSSNFFKH